MFRFVQFWVLVSFLPLFLNAQTLPTDTSIMFSGSGNCGMCHSAEGTTLVTQAGEDISPISTWRSTMMANASKDPLWQAKVTAEVIKNPHLQSVIEDKCTTCHAPMGRTEAVFHGADHFSFEEAMADPLSRDGVSCTLCHQIQKDNLGQEDSYSGRYKITDAHNIFGPYPNPTAMPMTNQTGFTPVHSPHIQTSEVCATCHTLFTPFVDDDGNVAGTLPEQTPYLEWLNSVYPEQNTECQTCHMPVVDEAIKIASRPPWLTTKQQPVWKHDFVGANSYMVSLIRENASDLGATASSVHFDSTLVKEKSMLEDDAVELDIDGYFENDSLYIIVEVMNKSGHKFPTGFPSRRAWLLLEVKNNHDEIIFTSGGWDEGGEIIGLDADYEQHYEVIRSGDQVQIYESIMQDINGDVTYTLLRGAEYKKDNRLPPVGFRRTGDHYRDIAIAGEAVKDDNFSPDNVAGSGHDRVTFIIPAKEQSYNLSAAMYYQTITPRFANDLFEYDTDKVKTFKNYYDAKSNTPIFIDRVNTSVVNTSINSQESSMPEDFELNNYPNPFNSATTIEYVMPRDGIVDIKITDMLGRDVRTVVTGEKTAGTHQIIWNGLDNTGSQVSSGVYFCTMTTDRFTETRKLLLIR